MSHKTIVVSLSVSLTSDVFNVVTPSDNHVFVDQKHIRISLSLFSGY